MDNKSKLLILIYAFVFIATCTLFITRGYYKKMSYISGDEPHYVMMTDSLIKDGDFEIISAKNDWLGINYYFVSYYSLSQCQAMSLLMILATLR